MSQKVCDNPICNSNQDCFCDTLGVHLVKDGADNPSFWKQKEPGIQREIEFEGSKVLVDCQQEIKPGDLYLAERNTGLKLLTCAEVKNGCIFNKEGEYPYDLYECKKVISFV